MKFLILQHINIEHPGIFLKFMKEDNIKIDTVELDENEKIPKLNQYDAMIVMGGPMDTWQEETYPWLKPEKEAIHKFVCVNKKPFLGLCLGAQLLSEAVGGKVRKMKTPEIGVLKVSVTDDKSLFKGLNKDLKVLQWHSYEVQGLEDNKDVTHLASSPETKYQIFKYQNHAYGIQFHIEVKDTTVGEWGCVPEYKSALEKQLGEGALDKFEKDSQKHMPSMNQYSKILYENFKKLLQ